MPGVPVASYGSMIYQYLIRKQTVNKIQFRSTNINLPLFLFTEAGLAVF